MIPVFTDFSHPGMRMPKGMESWEPGNRTCVKTAVKFPALTQCTLFSHRLVERGWCTVSSHDALPHRQMPVPPPSLPSLSLTSCLACPIRLSSSSGIILPLGDTELRHSVMPSTQQATDVLSGSSVSSLQPRPPPTRLLPLSLLPSICFHKVHVLSANPKEGGRFLHGVMTLNSRGRGKGER